MALIPCLCCPCKECEDKPPCKYCLEEADSGIEEEE